MGGGSGEVKDDRFVARIAEGAQVVLVQQGPHHGIGRLYHQRPGARGNP
ncbi:hypothetical protein GCM10020000_86040 [Streptomyces olivoverticillatus]